MSLSSDLMLKTRDTINTSILNSIISSISLTLPPSEVNLVLANLSDSVSLADAASLESIVNPVVAIAEERTQQMGEALGNAQKDIEQSSSSVSNLGVQDNISPFKVPEMPVFSSRFTKVPNFPIASNNLSEDYPNTEGKIDDAKNWIKINKTTGFTEFVHNSGSSLKIDREGNTSIHITGSLKLVIDKDFLTNALGSLDLHSVKDMSIEGSNIHFGY